MSDARTPGDVCYVHDGICAPLRVATIHLNASHEAQGLNREPPGRYRAMLASCTLSFETNTIASFL